MVRDDGGSKGGGQLDFITAYMQHAGPTGAGPTSARLEDCKMQDKKEDAGCKTRTPSPDETYIRERCCCLGV